MLGDVAVSLPADDGGPAGSNPAPDALGDDALEVLIRDARAGVAQLTLQLRALQRDARPADGDQPSPAFVKARDLLKASLDQRFAFRRRAMLEEEAAVRVEAARRIRAAHEEGAALIAQANAGCLAVLVGGLRSPGEAGPELRIVAEPSPAPSEVPARPASPAPAPPAIDATTALAPPPSATLAVATPAAATPVHATLVHAPAAHAPAAPAPVRQPVVPVAGEGSPAPAPMRPAPPTHHRSRPGWKSYLYLDVMLPLVAVLVVLAVLLAWVG